MNVKPSLRKLFVIPLILMGQALSAQSTIDSLEKELRKTVSDSLKVVILNKLSGATIDSDVDRGEKYALQALKIAEEKNWDWAKAVAYLRMSYIASTRGDYTTALKYDNLSLPITIALNDSSKIASALNYLGNTYFDLGEYDDAYYYFTQSYRVTKAIKDSLQMTIALHNIGTVFRELGQYDVALNYLELSRKISKMVKDEDGEAYSLDEIGDLYLDKKDFDQAEEKLLASLAVTRKRNIESLEPEILGKIAHLYFEKNQLGKALAYYDSTTYFYKKSFNNFGLAETALGTGKVYLKQGKYDDAMRLFEETLAKAKELNSRTLEIDCFHELSQLYEQKGDFKKSLGYYKNFKALQDSLYSHDMMTKLYQDQLRFETETKDTEIAALSLANSKRGSELKRTEFIRNILVVMMALAAILLFSVYRSGQRRIRINKLLMDHQDDIKRRSLELEQLNQVKDKFFSIISHDLRSPMNALSALLDLLDRKQVTMEEFTKLTKELRVQFNHTKTLINNLLDWTLLQMDKLKIQSEKVDIKKMVDDNFKLLSSLHLKESTMINEIEPGTFAWADANIINLVFRNLILNGIKFSDAGGKIEVSSKENGDQYVIAVKDNGVGITPEVQKILFEKTSGYSTRGTANEKGTGLGLILCKEFVEKNGGKIWLESELGKGSTFYFTVRKAA
jgi:signal transduction histidine kinase/predicted negative regulator of RcsB-dependent stress response